ncbi:MAG: polysaccharide biosynthesis protein [Rhodobacterales bacterium]|nr:MAG: polysaccharide biosynthesis protein [Rhodobacterales bacterium]
MLLVLLAASGLAGCGLPAGAPLQSQILAQADAEDPSFEVVEVTQANLRQLRKWPATGWRGHYRWLTAGGGGPTNLVRADDRINLVIWDSQDNSLLASPGARATNMADLVVSPGGTIFVPYVGEVVLGGLSPQAARQVVQREIERISPSAQVQLTVVPGTTNSVDLVRGVQKPGPVPLPSRNFTILNAISAGGGIGTNLRNPLVRLIRDGKTYEIPAERLLSDGVHNIALRGGDKVIVDEDQRRFVIAGATGDRLVQFNREHITAMEALSMAGGLSESRADPGGILILRDYPASAVRADGRGGPPKQQVVFNVNLTTADGLFAAREFEIHPDDLVMVTEAPMVAGIQILNLVNKGILAYNRLK